MLIYINFSFDFLSLDNVEFENYFASKLINIGRYLSHLKHLQSCFIMQIENICISDKALPVLNTRLRSLPPCNL